MAKLKYRLRIDRVMLKADGVTVLLKIVSSMHISFYIWRLVRHGRKTKHIDVLGHLTLRQLDRLIEKLKLRLAHFKTPHGLRIEVKSSSLMIYTQGDCLSCFFTFIEPASSSKEQVSSIIASLSIRQLARFIANLERERAFAARETRKNMADD